jgi:hypothetical protein
MAIVETKITQRPNTSVAVSTLLIRQLIADEKPEYSARHLQKITNLFGAHTQLINDGDHKKTSYNVNGINNAIVFEGNCDETGLIHTRTGTFANLELFGMNKSAQGIEDDAVYLDYAQRVNLSAGQGQYILSGIDAPFTCTTTYTYDPATISTTYPLFESFVGVLESSDKLTAFTNTGTQLSAVHTYNDAADYTENQWKDRTFVPSLHAGGVTRTIACAMV